MVLSASNHASHFTFSRLSTGHSSCRSRTPRAGHLAPTPKQDPGCRTEPRKAFVTNEVKEIIQEVFHSMFSATTYDVEVVRRAAKTACERMKKQVKSLGYDRCKLVCFVHVVQHANQHVHVASRTLMDQEHDQFAEYVLSCDGFDVVGVVYGLYTC